MDTLRFDGQVAVVTGSGRGLGEAYVRLLAADGARVVVHDAGVSLQGEGSDTSVADGVVQDIQASGGQAIACYENIETREGCQHLIEKAMQAFGRVDILVSNAGWISYTALEDTTPELFERIVNIQIAAPYWLAQAIFPIMRQQQYGRIVLTTSNRAIFQEYALPELSGYAFGKMAQLGLMNAFAAAGQDADIRVNCICPVAATRMFRAPVAANTVQAEQVAPGVAFLASHACDFSGKVLLANDGHFSLLNWSEGPEISFGNEPITLESFANRWHELQA